MKQIKTIEIQGGYDTRRVTPWDYAETCVEFAKDGIILPKWTALKKIGDRSDLWILLEPLTVTVTFKDGEWWQWLFDRGFIWDQASVPLFRNNRLTAIVPAMIHDGGFSLHWYSFSDTNKLFYRMIRKFGMNWLQANIYYLAVNSMIGRAIWEKNTRKFWHSKTAHFMQGRKHDN
jgi:hypothetical protein